VKVILEAAGLAQPVGVPVTCCGHQVPTTISFGVGSGSGSGSNSGGGSSQQRKSRGRSPQVTQKLSKDGFDVSPKAVPPRKRKRKMSGGGGSGVSSGGGGGTIGVHPGEMFLLQSSSSPYRNYPPTSFEFLVRNNLLLENYYLLIGMNE
jgi:hypothetical protein